MMGARGSVLPYKPSGLTLSSNAASSTSCATSTRRSAPPENLSDKQRRRRRKKVFKDFRQIWEARRYDTMLRRYLKVVRTYRDTQPRGGRYFASRLPLDRHLLRSGARSSRPGNASICAQPVALNASIADSAAELRAANAYHSETGINAMLAQETHEFHAAQRTR